MSTRSDYKTEESHRLAITQGDGELTEVGRRRNPTFSGKTVSPQVLCKPSWGGSDGRVAQELAVVVGTPSGRYRGAWWWHRWRPGAAFGCPDGDRQGHLAPSMYRGSMMCLALPKLKTRLLVLRCRLVHSG